VNIRGTHTLGARRDDVFAAICDPDALLAVIPGCRDIEQVGDAEYRGRISLRLPGVVGTYRTVVRLVDADPPTRGDLEGELEGSLGTIRGRATFRLADAGEGTRIDYEGQGVIGGPLARFDSRFVEGLAASLIEQGLRNLDSRLSGGRPVAPGSRDNPPTREIRA
jgi:2-furoyl-CoA dehydrogenase large subunit